MLDKSKQNTDQPPTLAKNRPKRRLGRIRLNAYNVSALTLQEPPKSKEYLTSLG